MQTGLRCFYVFFLILFSFNTTAQSDGDLDNSFDPGSGASHWVSTTAIQSDGKILIGGDLISYNGTPRNRIARVNVDGSLDSSFDPGLGANNRILTIVIQPDGKILIGGSFTTYDGISRNSIARLNSDGTVDTTFDPGSGANDRVDAIAVQPDGKIVIGGYFTNYNGMPRNRIARLNNDGSFDSSFNPGTGANAGVLSITLQPDGKIIVGGFFVFFNSTTSRRIARLNPDGSLDASFTLGFGAGDVVWSTAIQPDGKILVGGGFITFNSTSRNRIARLNADGSLDPSFDIGTGASNWVMTVVVQSDGKILMGGAFGYYNGNLSPGIVRLNSDGSYDPSFSVGTGANSPVYTIAHQSDGNIIISGEFTNYSGISRNRVARLINAAPQSYIYDNGVWTPENPSGISTLDNNVIILNGQANLTLDTEISNLTINQGASLNTNKVLMVGGDIHNDGTFVFESDEYSTGQLDVFTGTITGSGNFTVQRFIPGRRAYRLLSTAVTTTGSIRDNWQEGANNPDFVTNIDPNPGFGTHITGSDTGANGFDATPMGNPSLFIHENASQSWVAVTNTNINTLQAGTPYHILVRGDRGIDVTDSSANPVKTILQSTGSIFTGTYSDNSFSANENDFNFFGNPFQAIVDMNQVISASTNINSGFYYVLDPNLNGANGRGAYVTIELPNGTNPIGSDANEYLQPGQAAFVTTLINAPASLTMEENHKAVDQSQTSVFGSPVKLDLRLYDAISYANTNTPADGLRIKFDENGNNSLDSLDAPKLYNQDENIASIHNGRLYSMESRAIPQIGEVIPLYIDQFRMTDYIFEIDLMGLQGVSAFLKDSFTGDETLLENDGISIYSFNIIPGNAASMYDDRFEIFFTDKNLDVNTPVFGNEFILFPNPVKNGTFYIATSGLEEQDVSIKVHNMLGQEVFTTTKDVTTGGRVEVNLPSLPFGVYSVTLKDINGNSFTSKLINR